MTCTPATTLLSGLAACGDARAGQPARRGHRHALGSATMTVAAVATVLSALAAAPAQAQAPRNGPEWGGKDHQPTQAEVTRSEDRAGVQPSQAENQADTRSVEQLDKQLLNKEGINSSSVPAPSAPR